ncbi:NB-ARC domains-containing protein [Artemisia annua]|uniref:NB-ARC domains-containing protein n=1 Tax=Artemisia annua TaxID=35608 RepID=A0A2U1MSA7_ARTAN|nr:NB-ARC domains-containing protein [Artemisia annua]
MVWVPGSLYVERYDGEKCFRWIEEWGFRLAFGEDEAKWLETGTKRVRVQGDRGCEQAVGNWCHKLAAVVDSVGPVGGIGLQHYWPGDIRGRQNTTTSIEGFENKFARGDGLLRSLVLVAPSVTKLEIESTSGLTNEVWREAEASSKVLVSLQKLKVIECKNLACLGKKDEEDQVQIVASYSLLSSSPELLASKAIGVPCLLVTTYNASNYWS